MQKIMICPHCGGKEFIVSAHIAQDWIVDEKGNFLSVSEECTDVIHYPDLEDIWQCTSCGAEVTGSDLQFQRYGKSISWPDGAVLESYLILHNKAALVVSIPGEKEEPFYYMLLDIIPGTPIDEIAEQVGKDPNGEGSCGMYRTRVGAEEDAIKALGLLEE